MLTIFLKSGKCPCTPLYSYVRMESICKKVVTTFLALPHPSYHHSAADISDRVNRSDRYASYERPRPLLPLQSEYLPSPKAKRHSSQLLFSKSVQGTPTPGPFAPRGPVVSLLPLWGDPSNVVLMWKNDGGEQINWETSKVDYIMQNTRDLVSNALLRFSFTTSKKWDANIQVNFSWTLN